MHDTQRELMNVRVIRTTFRVAVESHPQHAAGAAERARMLLEQVRQRTSSPVVLAAIADVELEIDGRHMSNGGTMFR